MVLLSAVFVLVDFGMKLKTNSKLKALPAAPTLAVNISLENMLKSVIVVDTNDHF